MTSLNFSQNTMIKKSRRKRIDNIEELKKLVCNVNSGNDYNLIVRLEDVCTKVENLFIEVLV